MSIDTQTQPTETEQPQEQEQQPATVEMIQLTLGQLAQGASLAEVQATASGTWKIGADRARKASHLVAVSRGTVRGVFKISSLSKGKRADGSPGIDFVLQRLPKNDALQAALLGGPQLRRSSGNPVGFVQVPTDDAEYQAWLSDRRADTKALKDERARVAADKEAKEKQRKQLAATKARKAIEAARKPQPVDTDAAAPVPAVLAGVTRDKASK